MNDGMTISDIQEAIRRREGRPDEVRQFLKLIDAVGALARKLEANADLREELGEVLYYTLAIASSCEVEMEECLPVGGAGASGVSTPKKRREVDFRPFDQ